MNKLGNAFFHSTSGIAQNLNAEDAIQRTSMLGGQFKENLQVSFQG